MENRVELTNHKTGEVRDFSPEEFVPIALTFSKNAEAARDVAAYQHAANAPRPVGDFWQAVRGLIEDQVGSIERTGPEYVGHFDWESPA